jgi:ketosteroid isomerase-like protein
MSQENVEVVRRLNAMFNSGELEAVLDFVDPDFEWVPAVSDLPAVKGRENVKRFFQDQVLGRFDQLRAEPEEFFDAGDTVVMIVHLQGSMRGGEANVDYRLAQLWTFDGGIAVRAEGYLERQEALRAAGLSE